MTKTLRADLHAHPGRCFLHGLPEEDGQLRALGGTQLDAALEDLHESGMGLVSFATVSDMRVLGLRGEGLCAMRSFQPGEAWADHTRQLGALRAIAEREGVRLILAPGDLEAAQGAGELGLMATCEGGDFLEGRLERVEEAHRDGARSITLVHYRVNELGDIQTEAPVHGGLTEFGAEVVCEMNRLCMLVDLAHATWDVTRDVLECSSQPVMISHSHLARGPDSHPRLLSPEHALAVSRSGGLVGAWPSGVHCQTFDDFLDEILRLVDLLGIASVAMGTDMDGNYKPVMTRYAQYPDLATGLRERGLDAGEVDDLLGGNFQRLFRKIAG
jgi:membrane dipeptidase